MAAASHTTLLIAAARVENENARYSIGIARRRLASKRCQQHYRRGAQRGHGWHAFSELPGERHGVSANASKTKPCKLLAVFVLDTNETELTIPFAD
jgi:hypothetical protein